jgi:hypothetical protein
MLNIEDALVSKHRLAVSIEIGARLKSSKEMKFTKFPQITHLDNGKKNFFKLV